MISRGTWWIIQTDIFGRAIRDKIETFFFETARILSSNKKSFLRNIVIRVRFLPNRELSVYVEKTSTIVYICRLNDAVLFKLLWFFWDYYSVREQPLSFFAALQTQTRNIYSHPPSSSSNDELSPTAMTTPDYHYTMPLVPAHSDFKKKEVMLLQSRLNNTYKRQIRISSPFHVLRLDN